VRLVRIKETPAQPGEAIQAKWTTRRELAKLRALIVKAKKQGDLRTWRRGKAVRDYINGKKVLVIAAELEVVRASVNQWLRWYDTAGTEALQPRKAPGPAPRLDPGQRAELTRLIEEGPQAAGYTGGLWTGPRIGDLIRRRFGVRYHNHHIPRLLHRLGFSVQRPRKRLARADKEAQEIWITKRLPAIRKKAARCRGVVVFEDEASFWQDGSLHRTWSRVGVQPRVDTYGLRKTAHIFGAVALDTAKFTFRFADVFNGATFFEFLRQLVGRYDGRKVFLIIDNAPYHWLEDDGKRWLRQNRHRIEIHRLPPYSPEFMPMEGVWKTTRKLTTHNAFFVTPDQRDAKLTETFNVFQRRPEVIAAHVARFR
jgi:transposase